MDKFVEKASLCALNRIFGFEPKIAAALIDHFGSAAEVMKQKQDEMDLLLGPHSKYSGQIGRHSLEKASRELEEIEKKGIRFTGITEESYPDMLRECEDPPIGLYVRSSTPLDSLFARRKGIAIVGTRDSSLYGEEWCKKTVASMATLPEKPAVVSGLALGIDACAHRTALENGIPTIAVMATGPDTVYPWRNRGIAEQIVSSSGCALITDYPPGTAPLAVHFLRRNRIIAGLSDATLLIESKMRGGGMMTARLAFSYGREVFALPGRADDIRSQGCNHLIKSKIAEPITSIDGLFKDLGFKAASGRQSVPCGEAVSQRYRNMLPEDKIDRMAAILTVIRKHRGITIEETAMETGMEYSTAAELTGILETDGFISIDLLQRCTINFRNNM